MTNKTDQLTPRRRPSQERSRDRVESILDATAALLAGEMPADKITTAAIAEEAGVPVSNPRPLRTGTCHKTRAPATTGEPK